MMRRLEKKSKQSLKEVPFADKAQKYIHVLPFNTIVFLIFFQAKADVRRDYGAFIASKYYKSHITSCEKTPCIFFLPSHFPPKKPRLFSNASINILCTAAKLDLCLPHTKKEPCLTWDFLTPSKMSVFAEK